MEKTREIEHCLRWKFKLRVLEFAKDYGKVKETCEMFNVSRSTCFNWKRRFDEHCAKGLLRKRREADTCPKRINQRTVELMLNLRKEYKLGTWCIKWYLERYHDINVSESSVCRTLKRNGVKPLKRNIAKRAMGPARYAKETSGHHVQVDVKCLVFHTNEGK
ncbi:helix-turn-helix domain-containing protein [Flagellimonas ochracea]|uniref:helix-turn-helix domain-containing protein n=1 Tax=Flagellimonas ochracea TaxID=2696472 RepID=UPI003AAB1064